MKLNLVLHTSTTALLLANDPNICQAFQSLKTQHHLWLPVCSLPSLQAHPPESAALAALLTEVKLLSSAGVTVDQLDTTALQDSLIGLAAADLPGTTALWCEQPLAVATPLPQGNQAFIMDWTQRQPLTFPFIDLPSQQLDLRPQLERGLFDILKHGNYIMGKEIEQFERQLADFIGVKHALACSNGTDTLLMALMAYGVKPGDAILTTPFTFFATAEVISLLGAVPVFVDIDPRTYNLDPQQLALTIEKTQQTHRLRGIIAVDLFGLPADYDPIMALAQQHGLFVIEDAAQGLAGLYHGRRAGALGHINTTSFFPAKPLGCYGDGGAIFTDDTACYEKLVSIRVHGQHNNDRYENVRIGLNARCDTFQAAILKPKLAVYTTEIAERQRVADTYSQQLQHSVVTPYIPPGLSSVWAQYSIQSPYRTQIQNALKQHNIPTAVYYPKPLHLQTAFADLGYKVGDFPVSEAISQQIFSLPMNPYLTLQQITAICDVIKQAVTAAATNPV